MSAKSKKTKRDYTKDIDPELAPKPAKKAKKAEEEAETVAPAPVVSPAAAAAPALPNISGKGSAGATKRLLKELERLQAMNKDEEGVEAEMNDDNMYLWDVKLYNFPAECKLAKDLKKRKLASVTLQVQFPQNFPWEPPFIRVVAPRFAFHTGHVTVGGSICMELLTKTGWQPTNTIEAVLIQIRSEMVAGEARLDPHDQRPYTEAEAREAFVRVARSHGWDV